MNPALLTRFTKYTHQSTSLLAKVRSVFAKLKEAAAECPMADGEHLRILTLRKEKKKNYLQFNIEVLLMAHGNQNCIPSLSHAIHFGVILIYTNC